MNSRVMNSLMFAAREVFELILVEEALSSSFGLVNTLKLCCEKKDLQCGVQKGSQE